MKSLGSVNRVSRVKGPVLNAAKTVSGEIVKAQHNSAHCGVATSASNERRGSKRHRTRFYTGKIFGAEGPSLVDCQIVDWSKTGARLRLFASVPLPLKIVLFDEVSEKLTDAKIMWSRDREIGIAFLPFARPRELTSAQLACLHAGYKSAEL